jgi:ssDNA-binding Zn-finger/Zn-ribbon topoisomerase 1
MALLRDALGEDLEGLRTFEALTTRMREVLQEIRTSRRILEHESAIVEDQLRIGMKHQCSCCGIAVLLKKGRCCGDVWYCCQECHLKDWINHKPLCLRRPFRRAVEHPGPTLPPRRQVTMHLMGQPEYRGMSVEEVEEILRVEDEAAEQALMHSFVQDAEDEDAEDVD